jgi:arylsulfatase A-like enzyme
MGIHRRTFLQALGAAAVTAGQAPPVNRKPNIVFIMADDLGYGDPGCYGQRTLRTPNIDRIGSEGIRFTDCYAGSTVCAPSRCALMTGMHMGHATVRGNHRPEIPLRPEDVTVAEVLQSAGYHTAQFGKWGVGGPLTTGRPNIQGFDEFFGYLSQQHAHTFYPDHLWENEVETFLPRNFSGMNKTYSHDLFTERALAFLGRDHKQPFFLYLPYTVPHANNELGGATGNGMEIPDYGSFAGKDWPNPEKGFAAMIERLDRDVGRILTKLAELGIDENTLVFFTSDNGPHREGGHDPEFFQSRGPLRGIKRDLYEGGIRVPMLARWPEKIRGGQVSGQPWAFWDLLPTLAELAGAAAPRGIDGISMAPALLGRVQKSHEYLYWEFHERGFAQAVRMGNWKGVRPSMGASVELYDLKTDLGEQRNIAGPNSEIVRRIETIMRDARTESLDFPVRA